LGIWRRRVKASIEGGKRSKETKKKAPKKKDLKRD
jgi:hypothetical protein